MSSKWDMEKISSKTGWGGWRMADKQCGEIAGTLSTGGDFTPLGDTQQCLETCLVATAGEGGSLLAWSR